MTATKIPFRFTIVNPTSLLPFTTNMPDPVPSEHLSVDANPSNAHPYLAADGRGKPLVTLVGGSLDLLNSRIGDGQLKVTIIDAGGQTASSFPGNVLARWLPTPSSSVAGVLPDVSGGGFDAAFGPGPAAFPSDASPPPYLYYDYISGQFVYARVPSFRNDLAQAALIGVVKLPGTIPSDGASYLCARFGSYGSGAHSAFDLALGYDEIAGTFNAKAEIDESGSPTTYGPSDAATHGAGETCSVGMEVNDASVDLYVNGALVDSHALMYPGSSLLQYDAGCVFNVGFGGSGALYGIKQALIGDLWAFDGPIGAGGFSTLHAFLKTEYPALP